MKAKEACEYYDVSYTALRTWAKANKIPFEILPSCRVNYLKPEPESNHKRKNIIYGRVSTSSQKENLERQIERLKLFCSSKGIVIDQVIQDIASALNYNRNGYSKLLEMILNNEVETVIIEYKDRLVRIGFEQFKQICDFFKTEVIVIDESETKTYAQEITEDLISIIHHYSMRLYSSRKRKKIKTVLEEKED